MSSNVESHFAKSEKTPAETVRLLLRQKMVGIEKIVGIEHKKKRLSYSGASFARKTRERAGPSACPYRILR